jgi:hypothetical protein
VRDTIHYYDTVSVPDTLVIVLNPESNNPADNQVMISIFPNPSSETIFISTSDPFNTGQYKVKIINSLGSPVCEFPLDSDLKEVDLDRLGGPGIYYLQILDDKSEIIEVRKILLIQ